MRVLSCSMLGLLALAALAPHAADAQRRQGTLVLQGDHPGAEVYVDAELIGEMPLEPVPLEPGSHTIRIVRPGYTEYTDVFRIRPRRETSVTVDLMAISMALAVNSAPVGANVHVDENFAGTTPVTLELLEGTHQLRIELRGYHDVTREVSAVPGWEESIDVTLEQLPEEERQRLFQTPDPEWYEEPLTWILVGGGAVAVALGIILVVVLTSSSDSQSDEFCAGDACIWRARPIFEPPQM